MTDFSPHKSGSNCSGLGPDLVTFYDEFVELQDAYAFLGDAITALMRTNAELDRATLEGMSAFANDTKQSAGELKGKLKIILEQHVKGINSSRIQ